MLRILFSIFFLSLSATNTPLTQFDLVTRTQNSLRNNISTLTYEDVVAELDLLKSDCEKYNLDEQATLKDLLWYFSMYLVVDLQMVALALSLGVPLLGNYLRVRDERNDNRFTIERSLARLEAQGCTGRTGYEFYHARLSNELSEANKTAFFNSILDTFKLTGLGILALIGGGCLAHYLYIKWHGFDAKVQIIIQEINRRRSGLSAYQISKNCS